MRPKIIHTEHLLLRIKLRSIPKALPEGIYLKSSERYYDTMTGHHIAVMSAHWGGKMREFVLSYDVQNDRVELITIHPIKTLQKLARVKIGRWRRL